MTPIIGYTFPRGLGCRAIYEDQAGEQFRPRRRGPARLWRYQIPEDECLRAAAALGATSSDPIIGRRLFVDGIERDVHRDDQGQQYVIGPDGERVYGICVLTDDVWDDVPVIV